MPHAKTESARLSAMHPVIAQRWRRKKGRSGYPPMKYWIRKGLAPHMHSHKVHRVHRVARHPRRLRVIP